MKTETVTLYFTKTFTKGLLVGLTSSVQSLGFTDTQSAMDWVAAIRSKSSRGRLSYALSDVSFQNFAR
jgi:hypothetical protein